MRGRIVGVVALAFCACGTAEVSEKKNPSAAGEKSGGGMLDDGGTPIFSLPNVTDPGPSPGSMGNPFGEEGPCNPLEVKFERQIPTVAIVIDRSSSMFAAYGNGGSRWDVLKKTLLDPKTGLIKPAEGDVRFGLAMYTGHAKKTCPWVEKVGFAVGNFDAITKLYAEAQPPKDIGPQDKGETPTGETIAQVAAELEKITEPGPKYIVLCTDGEPDTCPGTCTSNCSEADKAGWPRDPNCGHDRSITAVQAAAKKGIKTLVVGIGEELDKSVAVQHLQALANAGAGEPVALGKEQSDQLTSQCRIKPDLFTGTYVSSGGKTKYYKPANAAGLTADLEKVIGDVRTCKFTLKGKVNMRQASKGVVQVNGKTLTYGDPDGWKMNSETELEIVGGACTALQSSSQSTFKVGFPCGIFMTIG